MAYQIHENHMDDEHIVFIGVDKVGRAFADGLQSNLNEISPLKTSVYTILLDKENPLSKGISIDGELAEITRHPIILCDDVLNTGKTLTYSLSLLLNYHLKRVETAVLILRSYSTFPIYATYKGYQLATTINDHVKVVPGEGVFLS